ncbi:phage tail tape measure protein [Megamonas funiformis]|jgi:TP901 family phage tail tape measure protein|uniref:phage tail tape measure protein n=1 Tax=Megamonas funiformis TaxID=437897 RepID=UPI00205C57AB|nr:MAG TPA: minor tail protein [Caudoviricetes sp.]
MATQIDVTLRLIDMMTSPLVRVQNEMERTARAHQRMGRDIQRIGDGFSSVGESMLPIAAGITAIGAAGGRAFIDFDSIITGAAAKAGATAEEMEMMRQKASQFGANFPISATQAAEGMDRLAAAGYDANQVVGVMPSVITAAVASGEDLATTSDVVSNALNIWNLKQGDIASNAMRVADVVQMAANKSSLSMTDFGVAMQYAGAPAATLNISIEQLSTAMAIMKNNGIEASTIGTSLRSIFTRLSSPPKSAAEAIERLGLQVKDTQGNFLGIQPIIEQLRTKMIGMSDTEQVAIAQALAGQEAYSGLLALIKTAPQDYQAMDNATGSSQAQFEVMKGTLKNSIDGMLGSLESLAINFGSVLTPQIKAMTDAIGGFADMINTISPETKLLIGDILMGTVAFTGFMLAIGKVISIGGGIVKLYGDIGLAAKGGSIRNKALQFAVLNTVNAYKNLNKEITLLKTAQDGSKQSLFTGISAQIKQTIDSLKNNKPQLYINFKKEFDRIRALKWVDITTAIVNVMPKNPISSIKTTAITRLQKFRTSAILATESLSRMYRTFYMSRAMESFAGGIGRATKSIFGLVKASFAFALSPLGIALIAIAGAAYLIYKNWDMVGPYFISLWKRIETALISAWNKIKPAWDSLMNVIPKLKIAINPALVALDNIFTMAINGQGAFEPLISVLKIVASFFGGALVGAFIVAANVLVGTVVAAINVAAAIITGFLGVLEGVITFLTGVFTGNWEMAWQGIVKIFDSVFSTIKGIADGILGGVKETINGIIKSINSIKFTVQDIVPGIGGKTFEGLNIPLFANGVENFAGGPAIIHDKGAEIVDLPSGTRVIPHDKSIQTAYAQGRQDNQSNSNNFNFSINIYGANMKNDADMDELADKLMQRIYYQMQKRSINMNEGAV